jgi:GntR family transcriptional regulator
LFVALSPTHPDPMYKQVTDQLKDAIASGDLKPNDRLPSVRELSEALSVSAITVKRAYQDLEAGGYIVTRAGLGSFVAQLEPEVLRERKLAEVQAELRRLVRTSAKFGVSVDDIVRLTREVEGD